MAVGRATGRGALLPGCRDAAPRSRPAAREGAARWRGEAAEEAGKPRRSQVRPEDGVGGDATAPGGRRLAPGRDFTAAPCVRASTKATSQD